MPIRHALSTTNIALVAVFAGLIAASTLWPGAELVSGVPITLQTLAVLLAGAALGPWRGAAAVVLYLAVGTAGAPVFAGRSGGFAPWTGPTAGFLAGFVAAAFVTGWLVRRMRTRSQLTTTGIIGACAVGSLVVLNLIGWGFFAWRLHTSIAATAAIASPFLAGDIIKVFVAGTAAAAVHRAYPQLLGSVRAHTSAVETPAPVAVAASAGGNSGS
ncbi:MAG: hypothetical protein HGA51_06180 [Demequinaceae bacterium]|nr:hypothetical protein [Demequinaceae bacterium]